MLRIDNCRYCAALTRTDYSDLERLLDAVERGDAGCWLCSEDGQAHSEFDVFDGENKVWCGHSPTCGDVVSPGGD